jgi:hypothetical protein
LKNNEWLTAQSFEQAHETVSAINALSIHAKLKLAGIDDSPRNDDVCKARTRLLAFLDRLQAIVQDAEQDEDGAVRGTDPRLGQLAKSFLSLKSKWPHPPGLYATSFREVSALIQSEALEDQKDLVNFLRDLRCLLEQHAHADISSILGDV